MSSVTPLLHFTILLLEEEPVDKTPDDFQIVVAHLMEDGPSVELIPYSKQQHATFDHELVAQYVLRRVATLGRVYKAGDKFHVRVRFSDTHPPLEVVK